jgi:hypothetical protein
MPGSGLVPTEYLAAGSSDECACAHDERGRLEAEPRDL